MKKTNLLKKVIVSVLTLVIVLTSVNLLSNNSVEASTVYDPDTNTPASGNLFVSLDGAFSTASERTLVDRINQIRKEACEQGIINPETNAKLTMADYRPVVWSNELEAYARLRAAEASVNWAHTRPSNKSTFKNSIKLNNAYHSSENLAMGYDLVSSIEGYYAEKSAWINKTGMYGHYTSMISPSNTLVGMAGFAQNGKTTFSAMEFGSLFKGSDNNDHSRKGVSGAATQIVEVNVAYLVNSITLSGNDTIDVTQTTRLTATANMKNATKQATIVKGLTWTSSNNNVATVDQNGIVRGTGTGTATITVACGGKTASFKITVNGVKRVASVRLNATTKKVSKGSELKLTATITPANASNKELVWTSSNPRIAKVDQNGNVKTVKTGTALITVTSKDGSKRATCKVTVTK